MLGLAFRSLNRRRMRVFLLSLTVIIAGSFLSAIMILGNSLLAAAGTGGIDAVGDEVNRQLIIILRDILLAFTILALFVGGFVIKNTFTVILTQRARELALMRVIGASKGQIFKLVLWEAVLIGLVGALAGIAIGTGIAQLFLTVAGAAGWDIPHTGLRFSPGVFSLPIILGILVTVVSSVLPAIKASRQAPLGVLTGVDNLIKNKVTVRLIVGGSIWALGALVAGLTILHELSPVEDDFGDPFTSSLAVVFRFLALFAGLSLAAIGFTVMAPVFAKSLAGRAMRLLRRSRFIGLRLAAGNIWRQPLRSAATANVLMIGITLITTVTVILGSFRATAIYFVEEFFPVDWAVCASEDDPEYCDFDLQPEAAIGPEVREQIVALDGELEVVGLRYGYEGFRVNGEGLREPDFERGRQLTDDTGAQPGSDPPALTDGGGFYNLGGIDTDAAAGEIIVEMTRIDLTEEDFAKLAAGEVYVWHWVFEEHGLEIGSEIELSYFGPQADAAVERTFVVGGTYDRYFDDMHFLVNNGVYAQFTGASAYTSLLIDSPSTFTDSEDLKRSLDEIIAGAGGLGIFGQQEILDQINLYFNRALNVFRGLLSLSFVVAVAGIFNTLILSVFERTREIGLLRAVGASKGLIRRMVSTEAVQIATLGVVMGTVLGIALAWGVVETGIQDFLETIPEDEGGDVIRFVFAVPWLELLLYYVIAVVLALAAAYWPSIKATRIKIVEALTAE